MSENILQETPAYQKILEKGREIGRQEARELASKGLHEEVHQDYIKDRRKLLLKIISARFSAFLKEAERNVEKIDNLDDLQRLIVEVASLPTLEQVFGYISSMNKGNEEG